jgi:DNA (cytosine-5)-methyltransferase 1
LYVAYWRTSLKRRPNWDKWLRPKAYCPSCNEPVDALQSFKRLGQDMGRYRSQYVYRCPRIACRGQIVEPEALAAATAINWAIPGTPIGERKDGLKPNTIARIEAGIRRYWEPLLTPSGGTWRDQATPLSAPMPTRTTRECDGIAIPPLVVPVEGRDGKQAAPATDPIRTQTCRRETALVFPPFVTPMRGGGDKEKARPITDPLHTVTSGGNHHGVVTSPDPLLVPYYSKSGARPVSEPLGALSTQIHYGVAVQDPLLVPYYGTGTARPASDPVGTLSTRDRYGLAQPGSSFDIDEVRFRMLDWEEIRAAMAFRDTYLVLPASKRDKVRLLGNAVTPPVAEVLMSALVECITGEDLEVASC